MKKQLLGWTILFFFTFSAFGGAKNISQQIADYDFRKVRWEMTLEEVYHAEDGRNLIFFKRNNHPGLVYKTSVADLPFLLTYQFDNENRLQRAIYSFNNPKAPDSDYPQNFSTLKTILEDKYGTPVSVRLGNLLFEATWETGRTKITLNLSGDSNFVLHLNIKYEHADGIDNHGTMDPNL